MKSIKSIYVQLLLTILLESLCVLCASAQSHQWERTNPGGGGAYSTVGASASGIIIAGSDLSGAYRSQDDGLSWDVIGANKGMTETHVSGLGFHRIDGDILFIGTENGIFHSDNGGDHVTMVLQGGYITDIEMGTDVDNRGYASYHPTYDSADGEIYRSDDTGLSWYQSSQNLPDGIRILKIVVNPEDADILYILTGQGRFACGPAEVYRSKDGGENWLHLTDNIDEVMDIAIDPLEPQNIFITTMNTDCNEEFYWTDLDGAIYKSENDGDSWEILSHHTGIIWIDNSNPSIIKLIDVREPYPWISSSGTWTSTDGGITFVKSGDVEDWDIFFNNDIFYCYSASYNGLCKTLGEDLSNKNNFFWVNYQWIFRTSDNGTTFDNIFTDEVSTDKWKSRGFDNVNMMDVAISDADPNIVYTAYFDIGLWRSLDGGESWQSCNDAIFSGNWEGNGGNCATVVADPSRANIVWASMSENQNGQNPTRLLKSNETGQKDSWVVSDIGLPHIDILGLSVSNDPDEQDRTLYATAGADVYKSTDDGNTWSMVLDCNGCRFTAIDMFDNDIVYSGGESGIWRSTDAGQNWQDISDPEMKGDSHFWNEEYTGVFDINCDPNNVNWVYITVIGENRGLYLSKNKGSTWDKILEDDFMRKVAIAPNNSKVLYATSSSAFEAGGYDDSSKGVLYSTDGGQNWTQQNDGMAYPFALAVDISRATTPIVFVGSPGTGFQKAKIPFFTSTENSQVHENVLIYPNPSNGQFNISTDDSIMSIQIMDVLGSIREISKTDNPMDVSDLIAGSYYIIIKTDNSSLTRKLIIIHND